MLLVALAVSVPALLTCLILGIQLGRQTRTLFANGLAANLETFALILQDSQKSLYDGLSRAAADNTLQITLDLDIRAQLATYIEAQRQVLRMAFLGVFDQESRMIAFSGEQGVRQPPWRLGATKEMSAPCIASREIDQQLAWCEGTMYLVSVVPIVRSQGVNLGDAGPRNKGGLLGHLIGGVPLADPTLIASLQKRQIAHPAIWVGNDLIYADIPARKFPPPDRTDASAVEYHLDQTDYLVAARSTSVGNGTLAYAVLVPLAALRSTLLTSVTTVAGLGLLLVVGTLIAVGFVTNRLLLPIRQLREGAA